MGDKEREKLEREVLTFQFPEALSALEEERDELSTPQEFLADARKDFAEYYAAAIPADATLLDGLVMAPELVEMEVWLKATAYNLVGALMFEAAWTHGVEPDRLSFKGTVDTLRQ